MKWKKEGEEKVFKNRHQPTSSLGFEITRKWNSKRSHQFATATTVMYCAMNYAYIISHSIHYTKREKKYKIHSATKDSCKHQEKETETRLPLEIKFVFD